MNVPTNQALRPFADVNFIINFAIYYFQSKNYGFDYFQVSCDAYICQKRCYDPPPLPMASVQWLYQWMLVKVKHIFRELSKPFQI